MSVFVPSKVPSALHSKVTGIIGDVSKFAQLHKIQDKDTKNTDPRDTADTLKCIKILRRAMNPTGDVTLEGPPPLEPADGGARADGGVRAAGYEIGDGEYGPPPLLGRADDSGRTSPSTKSMLGATARLNFK